ncbi:MULTISPECIES: hypothetical protein [Streptomyces]|uniref:Uncharacterized protein n=1 Tax=Streptomyces lycii TaxID=2654337 RepID=A0ABQ7FRG8_9ACTN|nr:MULTISPECIES: hypothetical protein [Streptomyces]KAF4409988.1 hypothetical protein GCU69_06200 [Streptomyces lycii]PGH47937.1 hypothetical protein CRI70_25760 [Streptomyces sp. Ru87]
MKRITAATAVAASALALVVTGGAAGAAAAENPEARTAASAAQAGPWFKYGTYPDVATCGHTGHNLVNRDVYADYTCTRTSGGYELWVRT